jgi:hypothetical protein
MNSAIITSTAGCQTELASTGTQQNPTLANSSRHFNYSPSTYRPLPCSFSGLGLLFFGGGLDLCDAGLDSLGLASGCDCRVVFSERDWFAADPSFLFAFFAGGVNERNPSLEAALPLPAGADARASFGDIAGA